MRRGFLLLLLPALWTAPGSAESPPRLGEVLRVRPRVTGEAPPRIERSSLKIKDPIVLGMRVSTSSRAGTAILFAPPEGPSGLVQLGPRTDLTFGARDLERITDTIRGDFWTILHGRIQARFAPGATTGERRITITAGRGDERISVELYGTSIHLDVARDGSVFLAVLEGHVEVRSRAGGVRVPAGRQTSIAPGEPPAPPVPFSFRPGGGLDLRPPGESWFLEPPLIDLDDPRLNLPK